MTIKKQSCFTVLAGLMLLAGCISPQLIQHNRAYDAAVQPVPVKAHYSTTSEELLSIWGKSQPYFCDSSDSTSHYLVLYYDAWLKRKYCYKVPNTTKFATIRAVATRDTLRHRMLVMLE